MEWCCINTKCNEKSSIGFGRTRQVLARVITNTRSDQVRTGTRTRIVEQVENQVVVIE